MDKVVIPDWLRVKLANEMQNLRDKADHNERQQGELQREVDAHKLAVKQYRAQADDLQRILDGTVTAPAINPMDQREFDKAVSRSIARESRRSGY